MPTARLEFHEPDFPFTVADTPRLRARVTADLRRIVDAVRKTDPAATSVLLTGGFARGEGSSLDERPLNDYDLVVARAKHGGAEAFTPLVERLEADLGLHVDLHPIWAARLPFVSRKIFWYETAHTGRVLAGDPRAFARLPRFPPGRIRRDEAARLLFNRAVGLLEALPQPGEKADVERVNRHASKAILACGEAALVLTGRYRPTYRDRLNALPSPHYEWATLYKLAPAKHTHHDLATLWEESRDHVLAALAETLPRCGWGSLPEYPRRAPVTPTEAAWGLLHRARPRLRPSHEVRALTVHLLKAADFPEGPRLSPDVRKSFARVGAPPGPEAWPVTALLRARARTLQ